MTSSEEVVVAVNPSLLALLVERGAERLSFQGGRLSYPGRKDLEAEMGGLDPYTISHEARTAKGLPIDLTAAVRFLARQVTLAFGESDPRLGLLWGVHDEFSYGLAEPGEVSLDRFVGALVGVEQVRRGHGVTPESLEAAEVVLMGMHSLGLPPTHLGLEELFDGAFPACVGLGIVEI